MPEFEPLSEAQTTALGRYQKYSRLRAKFELERTSAIAELRVIAAQKRGLDGPGSQADAATLATLTGRESKAYARLAYLGRFVRLSEAVRRAALRQLDGRPEP